MPDKPKTELEAQLESLTAEFVARLVATIRNASFADVAALSARYSGTSSAGSSAYRPGPSRGRGASPKRESPGAMAPAASGIRTRQTAAKRAELSARVIQTLQGAGGALGVRALSDALGVPPDALAAPLRELRDKGIVRKHGDKRATTYST